VFQIGKELFYSIGQNGKLTQSNREQFALSLKGTIDFYEREVKDIKVVMVPEVFALMAGIEKKLLEGGALLLAGSSGNFRRSAVSLMSFKHKFQLLTPLVLRNPTLRDFNKDMKSFLELAGGQNKKVVLFLEDHQLQKSEFLEKINSLISSGEVPGLFTPEEVEHVIQEPEQLRVEYPGKSMYECFVERIRKNMVVVVSLDHRNKSFGQVCSANPAFFSKCRVIWLDCMRAGSLKLYSAQTLTGLPKVDGLS
jgi:dynein heavy chain 2